MASAEKCSSPSIIIDGKGVFQMQEACSNGIWVDKDTRTSKTVMRGKITKLSCVTGIIGSRNWGLLTSSLHIEPPTAKQ